MVIWPLSGGLKPHFCVSLLHGHGSAVSAETET